MLKLIKNDEKNKRNGIYECVCGTIKSIRKSAVSSGATKSCGCYRRVTAVNNSKKAVTHGMTNSFWYKKWTYLSKHFVLCEDWKDFSNFYEFVKNFDKHGVSIKPGFDILNKESILLTDVLVSKQENRKRTSIKKYGTEHPSQSNLVKDKIKHTQLFKYGDHPSRVQFVKEKIRQVILKKYGDHFTRTNSYKDKIKSKYRIHDGKSGVDIAKIIGTSNSLANSLIKKYGYEEALKYDKKYTFIEKAIKNLLDKHNINYQFSKKLQDKYADFVINDYKLIVECDGLYWHSDAVNDDPRYHIKKRFLYNSLGYRALFFREDEIYNSLLAIESIILNATKKCDKIYARKCVIKNLTKKEAKLFFDKNHIMKSGKGSTIALVYNEEIVCAIQIINRKTYIDISRFCTASGLSVTGGFSKLLKTLDIYNKDIHTFIDMRYGTGEYLPSLGFVKKSEHISFKWTKNCETKHRMVFKSNSGYEHGYNKIWDCGQARYIKKAPCGA